METKINWFNARSSFLIDFLLKRELKDREKIIWNRLRTKIQTAEKFILTHSDPFYKEIAYLLYWSCVNEIINKKFSITVNNLINIVTHEDLIKVVDMSESNYFIIKAKPRTLITNEYKWIYRKKNEKQSMTNNKILTQPSFLISVYLNLYSNPKYEFQYNFAILNKKRNKLSLIHDEQKIIATRNLYDRVDFSECMDMFCMTYFLICKKVISYPYSKQQHSSTRNKEGVALGNISRISKDIVTLGFPSGGQIEYPISEDCELLTSFAENDFVELNFEKEGDRFTKTVKDIIFLF